MDNGGDHIGEKKPPWLMFIVPVNLYYLGFGDRFTCIPRLESEREGALPLHISSFVIVIVIGIASNIDNIGIGFSYGARKIHVPWRSVLVIATTSLLAALIGGISGVIVSSFIGSVANFIGGSILICLGVFIIAQALIQRKQEKKEEVKLDKKISVWELGVVTIAQSITDLTAGFGTGVSHINVYETAFSIGLFSYLFLIVPAFIGRKYLANWFGNSATIVSGILLIAVGVHLF
ncbi:manganese efflux pump [Alicyclobacillus fastidiosus]|uniref:Manganese efflux pump n=1 Tax=Alicyclobacillus fastidiosus TaxID=392011 RepID=A0ABY6ZIG1_9BACL|nr:manganese efflux pump [Alicyclobacillus fastidiosus]WAH42713.1 manganese efflux pump [Alicyclobacillus fastidiosus]